MQYVLYVGLFWGGFILGFLTWAWFRHKIIEYDTSGTIVIKKDELAEKTIYSLELEDHPENLEFKNIVIFKVLSSEEKDDRK